MAQGALHALGRHVARLDDGKRAARRRSIASRRRESAGEVSASAPTPAAINAGTRAATASASSSGHCSRWIAEAPRWRRSACPNMRPRTLPSTTTAATAPPPQAAPACGIGASRPISATGPAGWRGERVEHGLRRGEHDDLRAVRTQLAEQARDARGDDGGAPARIGRVGVVAQQQQILPGQEPLQGAGDRDPVAVLGQDAHGAVGRQTRGRFFSGS